MTTQFDTTYTFQPNGAVVGSAPPASLTRARTLAEAISDFVNVKDMGAVGDGTTDDTAAIKRAFQAAWGVPNKSPYSGSPPPHSGTNPDLNRPIFFPAGTYMVTDTIYVEEVYGGWVLGAGSQITKLLYAGPIPNVYPTDNGFTNLFFINGMNATTFEGISFIMTNQGETSVVANDPSSNTCAFNWNWDGVVPVNSSGLLFIDVGFKGATIGITMADDSLTVRPGGVQIWGFECDVASWLNCWIDDCYWGARMFESNCLNCCWYGGSVKNCSQSGGFGFNFKAPIWLIQGVDFSNNDFDICVEVVNAMVVNCYTTSPNFALFGSGGSHIVGCVQNAAAPGHFLQASPPTLGGGHVIDSSTGNGDLYGAALFMTNESNNWRNRHVSGVDIREIVTSDVLNYADLPPASTSLGVILSIEDSTTAAWAGTAAGSGTNKVTVWSNGTNWKVIGA